MKDITEEQFEEYVRQLIDKKTTKAKLSKLLGTSERELNKKIQLLSISNPELYEEYISILPYKQKGYSHIDFEALAIYYLKNNVLIAQMVEKFGISERTIRRRIEKLDNKELVDLYKTVADNRKHASRNSAEVERKIDKLVSRPVIIGGVNDRRRLELRNIERQYAELSLKMSKTEAARQMGYTVERIGKLLNELNCIEIEESHKPDEQASIFRQGVKVSPSDLKEKQQGQDDTKTEKGREEEGR